jgi:hypothetical protein
MIYARVAAEKNTNIVTEFNILIIRILAGLCLFLKNKALQIS